jgi:hypothetical protein
VFAKVFICLHLVSGLLLHEEISLLVLFVYVGTAGAGLLTVPLACPGCFTSAITQAEIDYALASLSHAVMLLLACPFCHHRKRSRTVPLACAG